jgi:hypothetical protein
MTTGSFSDEQHLAVVSASPALVASHDKEGWLELFSSTAEVEDPVGTRPHRQQEGGLARFWEVFIAPNDVRFEVLEDIISPPFVVRDVVIRTHPSGGAGPKIEIPAYLLYELTDAEGQLKIKRLAAHWQLADASRQALGGGLSGLAQLASQGWRMLRVQGLGATAGYRRGALGGISRAGARMVQQLAGAISEGDSAGLTQLCSDQARIELPVGRPMAPGRLLELLDSRAGTTLQVRDLITTGWVTSCRFELRPVPPGHASGRGVGFFEFDPDTKRIRLARFFTAVRG